MTPTSPDGIVRGQYYIYLPDSRFIRFFTATGRLHGDGSWDYLGYDDILPDRTVLANLEGSVRHRSKVAQIQLRPDRAVAFFLLGAMTWEHLQQATEALDGSYIDIPNVEFEGTNLTVRVLRETDCGVAIADSEGNVLV